jgi:signal transduction histidine kinase
LGVALTRSQRAAGHLQELVNDVLDLAKIEAGRIELRKEEVDVAALTEDILLSVQATAEEYGTSVIQECDCDHPPRIFTDPRRVRQILLNLLSNALKFSAGSPVTLTCSRLPHGVAISVADQGTGIPEDEHQRIFEEFVQLDPGTHHGTGLGLPISRRLAELLGGTLTVSSTPGRGSTFTLMLPDA